MENNMDFFINLAAIYSIFFAVHIFSRIMISGRWFLSYRYLQVTMIKIGELPGNKVKRSSSGDYQLLLPYKEKGSIFIESSISGRNTPNETKIRICELDSPTGCKYINFGILNKKNIQKFEKIAKKFSISSEAKDNILIVIQKLIALSPQEEIRRTNFDQGHMEVTLNGLLPVGKDFLPTLRKIIKCIEELRDLIPKEKILEESYEKEYAFLEEKSGINAAL